MLTSEEKHVRALKRRARVQLERLPALYEFVQRQRGKPAMVETPLTSKTDLVISGSPGSGNTVLREWLTYANPQIDIYSQLIFETDASMRGAAPSRARDEAKREVIERLQARELESLMARCQAAARPFFDVAI